jgi:UDP-glucuronate decarboxylase
MGGNMNAQRALVMGGAGFLGSHLCDALLRRGFEVVAMDDLSTGSRANLAHLATHPSFTFFRHDVREPFHVPVHRIFNLACPASPVHYQAHPVKTTLTSVLGTLHALRLAESCEARVLLASTSEVYGDPEVHPQPEGYRGAVNPVGVRACYDEGKRCAESLTMDFARSHGVSVRIARIFNTYGPRMARDDGRVVSNFIVQALAGEDLTIYGDGTQTRSFCYVHDMIDGILRLGESDVLGPVNLGNPEEFTVAELAREVQELTGSRSKVRHLPLPKDDPRVRRPDIERASRRLGFAPKVPLREGLAKTIESFRNTAWNPAAEAGRANGNGIPLTRQALNGGAGAR